jgi:hypothetical protein
MLGIEMDGMKYMQALVSNYHRSWKIDWIDVEIVYRFCFCCTQVPSRNLTMGQTAIVAHVNVECVCLYKENLSILNPNIKGINAVRRNKNIEAYPFPYSSLFRSISACEYSQSNARSMMPMTNAIKKPTTKNLW